MRRFDHRSLSGSVVHLCEWLRHSVASETSSRQSRRTHRYSQNGRGRNGFLECAALRGNFATGLLADSDHRRRLKVSSRLERGEQLETRTLLSRLSLFLDSGVVGDKITTNPNVL